MTGVGCFARRRASLLIWLMWVCAGLPSVNVWGAESYAPAVRQTYPRHLYWGDTHVHTYVSADAYSMGARITPDDAYRFAKGEKIRSDGQYAQLLDALDFMMVADHAENMGVFPQLAAKHPALINAEAGRRVFDALRRLPSTEQALGASTEAEYQAASHALQKGKSLKSQKFLLDDDFKRHIWHEVVDSAEKHNDPGHFTTFAGYEYSSGMLHRNVLFAGGPVHTKKIIPFSAFDSDNPEDLWAFLERYRKTTGSDVLSIPHNSNLSRGNMFKPTTFDGKKITAQYAKTRASIEPLMEVTQIKGDSETAPLISPSDNFAGHEKIWWDMMSKFSRPGDMAKLDQAKQSFARGALKTGLQLEAQVGVNPFKFGMLGSTDSHTGLATAREENFWGKTASHQPSPYRANNASIYSASGYAAVWATENTREAIFSALRRREVYATSGPRISLRFFAGWDFQPNDLLRPDFAEIGYQKGVPMGGDLLGSSTDRAPSFLISAVKDPRGANLDRIQIIKGWRDTSGQLHEKISEVDWSGDRRLTEDGQLPPVGSSVDIENATYLNSIGEHTLAAVWVDPSFKRDESAFYYVRVIEIPTLRWTTYDANFYQRLSAPSPQVIQERAYSSPIWYTP